ncbi:hypothetical protein GQ472_01640 [archaeon]|nr:hypothetical protein [archaeon]
MTTGFMTKGRGAGRKVIPMKDRPETVGKVRVKPATASQRLMESIHKTCNVRSADDLYPHSDISPNMRMDKDSVTAYVKDVRKPIDPPHVLKRFLDSMFKRSTSITDFEPVPRSVHPEADALMLINSDGDRTFIDKRYLRHVKAVLGDDVYVQFAESDAPVFFVDRKDRDAILIAPIFSEALRSYMFSKM